MLFSFKTFAFEFFKQGSLKLGTELSYVQGIEKPAQILSLAATFDYLILRQLSLGAEMLGYVAAEPGPSIRALSFAGSFRHYLHNWKSEGAFIDAAFGPIFSSPNFPWGGTSFNFVTKVGPGLLVPLNDKLFLRTGLRYWHLSNARIEGAERNPSINGIEIYVALLEDGSGL